MTLTGALVGGGVDRHDLVDLVGQRDLRPQAGEIDGRMAGIRGVGIGLD